MQRLAIYGTQKMIQEVGVWHTLFSHCVPGFLRRLSMLVDDGWQDTTIRIGPITLGYANGHKVIGCNGSGEIASCRASLDGLPR
jgi:hypothetical protein